MARGFDTRVGFKREALLYTNTWPSAAAIAVDTLLPVGEEALAEHATLAYSTTRTSNGSATHADVVAQDAAAPKTFDVRYQGLETIWACALGFQAKRISGTVFPEQLAVGAYKHRFEIDARLHGEAWELGDGFLLGELTLGQQKVRRMTAASYRGGISVWEAKSVMVNTLELSGAPGQALSMTLDTIAHSVSNTSVINTTTVVNALSNVLAPRVLWHAGVFRLRPYSTSTALSGSDVISTQGASVRLSNTLERSAGRRTGLFTEEPQRSTVAEVTGSLTLPRYLVDTLILAQRAGTAYMMDIKFTGGQIAATGQNYALNLYFPTMHFPTTDVRTSGPGRIPVTLPFTCREPTAAAAGMPATHHLGALTVEVVSGLATNPLL